MHKIIARKNISFLLSASHSWCNGDKNQGTRSSFVVSPLNAEIKQSRIYLTRTNNYFTRSKNSPPSSIIKLNLIPSPQHLEDRNNNRFYRVYSPPRVKTNLPPNQTILSSKSPLHAATSPKIEDKQFAIVVNCKACLEITSISLDGGTIHAFQKHNWQWAELLVRVSWSVAKLEDVSRGEGPRQRLSYRIHGGGKDGKRRRIGAGVALQKERGVCAIREWCYEKEGWSIDSCDHPPIRGEIIDYIDEQCERTRLYEIQIYT